MFGFLKKKKKQEVKNYATGVHCYTGNANWNEWDTEKAIEEGFKSSVPVYSCIKKRYDAVSSVPLIVEVLTAGEWVPTPTHPLQLLLNNPNPEMDMGELMRLLITHMDLGGNGYWKKVRGGKGDLTQELWPVMPYPMKLHCDAMGYPAYYKVGCKGTEILADNMCHFMYTNPNSFYFGQAPLQAAGKSVDVDNSAQAWQKISMQNRGVPDYMISFDSEMTPEQYEQAGEVIKKKTGTSSAREPLVASKAKVQQLSLSPVEMDFMETRRFSREEACSVYGVPSALIAEMGKVNLANAESARKLMWLDTVIPLLDELTAALTRNLAKEYGNDVRVNYDTSSVPALQVNYGERVATAKSLWSMGVPFNTINQRLELGFEDIDNGDVGYIASGVIPTSFDFEVEPSEEVKREVHDRILKSYQGQNND